LPDLALTLSHLSFLQPVEVLRRERAELAARPMWKKVVETFI